MRRNWRLATVVVIILPLLVGCAAPAAAPPVVQTVVVEKPVAQTVVVEKAVIQTVEVPKWVYVTPTPEPLPAKPVRGGTVRMTYYQPLTGIDVQLDQGGSQAWIIAKTCWDALVTRDDTRSIVPNLAETYDISADGLVYTFNLRKGVKFTNGKELKAEDVLYSIARMSDPAQSRQATRYEIVDKVEAADDYTVKVTIKEPYAPFLFSLSLPQAAIYPKDHVPSAENGWIGTGPFRIESVVESDEVTMVRNPNYWAAGEEQLPYLDKVIFTQIGDEMARFGVLLSNQSEIIWTPPHSARPNLQKMGDYTIYPGWETAEGIALSTFNVPAFANPLVREAINIAINREELVAVALDGVGRPRLGDWQKAGTWAYYDKGFVPAQGDLEKARALLKEAGYENGFSFTLSSWQDWPPEQKASQLIQAQLKKLNIEVKLEQIEPAIWSDKVYNGNIEAVFQGLGGPEEPDLDVRYFAHPEEAVVHNIWKSEKITQMIEEAARELDQEKRAERYHGIVEALYAHGEDTYTPWLWLWEEPQDIVMNTKRVHGFVDDNIGVMGSLKQLWVTD